MHGLSLVILTVLMFGGVLFIATRTVPLSCNCSDGTVVKDQRGALDSAKQRCTDLCQHHGGLAPAAATGATRK
jgi:hypothetical protein